MKKWLGVVCLALSCSLTFAEDTKRLETLSAKVALENSKGYFVLSDGSCWKVVSFLKRWRSLNEWWNNVQLAPECYNTDPNEWYVGTQINVLSKIENLNVSESNAVNQDFLKQCTHLIENCRTGAVLFAISLEPSDCVVQLFEEAFEEGYKKGLIEGNVKSNHLSAEAYQRGQADGYKSGYSEGYQSALDTRRPIN